jgi:hypothetical protein
MKRSHHITASSIAVANLLALNAFAQAPVAVPAAPPAEAAAAPAFEPAAAPAAAPAPAPAPAAPAAAPTAAKPAGTSDHDAMVGHLAVGYMGFSNVPFGFLQDTGNIYPDAQIARAPVVGVRYWFNSGLGLDAGFGLTTTFGSNSTPAAGGATTSTDASAPTAYVFHGGLPIAFAASNHYVFELIPEINFGYAQQAILNGDMSGMHFDMGARVGTEIHFGFIGIPQLALQASVGLKIDVNQTKTETTVAGVTSKSTSSRTVVGTTVYDNPWNIFLGNVSALYYL